MIGYTKERRRTKKLWGGPCPDFYAPCYVCQAWALFQQRGRASRWRSKKLDELVAEGNRQEELNEQNEE